LPLSAFYGKLTLLEKFQFRQLYNESALKICIFIIMARRKRTPDATIPTNEPKEKVQYKDAFQTTLTEKIERAGKIFEGRGKTALYALGALAVLLVLIFIFYRWNSSSNEQAQAALGKAIEISQAQISDTPPAAGSTIKTFKTEKERAEAAIAEFQAVIDKFGGDVAEKAKYFIAVNKLSVDRSAAIAELEELARSSGEVGKMSKFALAQAKAAEGKNDEAIALYRELAALENPIVAKETINFELAKLLEKQGQKEEAAEVYFQIAKAASELKDLEGKPVPLSTTASEAKKKLEELNPEKAKEIATPTPETNFGDSSVSPLGIQ
jgi:tetratricopeptide (TPR) repeat protein